MHAIGEYKYIRSTIPKIIDAVLLLLFIQKCLDSRSMINASKLTVECGSGFR
jgi:hypothetical protein